jgi:hypothetical protein
VDAVNKVRSREMKKILGNRLAGMVKQGFGFGAEEGFDLVDHAACLLD